MLLCQGEIDEWESARRWSMLTAGEPVPDGVFESFDRWRVRTVKRRASTSGSDGADGRYSESDEFTEASLDHRIETTIRDERIDVLIIDPWAVFYSGSENSNDEVEAALDKLRDLSMRYGVAWVIIHHVGKALEAREPEDLWRGASRLADWASTRVTLLPHYTAKQAEAQGMTRQQARRFVDVSFLRRSTPTDDFSITLDGPTGWWQSWNAPETAAAGRRVQLTVDDVIDTLKACGGEWASQRVAAQELDVAQHTAADLLARAVRQGVVEQFSGLHGAKGYRLPGDRLPALGEAS